MSAEPSISSRVAEQGQPEPRERRGLCGKAPKEPKAKAKASLCGSKPQEKPAQGSLVEEEKVVEPKAKAKGKARARRASQLERFKWT